MPYLPEDAAKKSNLYNNLINGDRLEYEREIEDLIKKQQISGSADSNMPLRDDNGILVSFESEVKGAKAVVSLQSAAAIQAHIWGIPGYCGHMSAAYPVSHSLEMIEKGLDSIQYTPDDIRQKWLNSVLANQYTMTEIADGTCYNRLKDR